MLHFYPSNYTENLATVVAQVMQVKPLKDPFSRELILIQSHGMGTWLQQQISSELGIAAMVDTTMPASFIWKLAEQLLPEDTVVPLFEKQNLRWQLMKVLPAKLQDPAYQPLANYLDAQARDGELPQQVMFQLCDRVADLFDAYQNYRSDWIYEWERGHRVFSSEEGLGGASDDSLLASTECWQYDLWHSVYEELAMDQRRHRPSVLEKLAKVLSQPKSARISSLPERLFVFGLSALPPQWLPLFELLSKHVDIHFLVFNPCQQYWGDIQTDQQQLALQKRLIEQGIAAETAAESVYEANPLLASWGRLGRDYVALLSQSSILSEIPVDLYEAPADKTALHALQSDILNLKSQVREVSPEDHSLRFAHCHSRLREVEALHDHLFHLLDANPDLSPKDIIVMMPDVETFAPLIQAVFSRPAVSHPGTSHPVRDEQERMQSLPYALSDQLLAMDQPLIEVVTGILQLTSLRISAKEVLDWLDIDAIRARFGIDESMLPVIHQWLERLSVRWGLSEQHRDQLLDTKHSGAGNTWLSAFRRLLAGFFYGQGKIGSEHLLRIKDDAHGRVLPFNLSDREEQTLAGNLMRLLDVIESTQVALEGQHSVAKWLELVSSIWQQWFDEERLAEDVQKLMDSALTKTLEQVQLAEFEDEVSFSLVADALLAHFQKERVSQRFLAGRINFCTLMPMRSIPFKVVCLIGMNEGEYPRPENQMSFDLMALSPARMGDRSRRSDDRYLFLEALCSAREHVYISYCAHDARDNSERFPSLLVSELRDYCDKHFRLQTDDETSILELWTVIHRLQPFHRYYYQEDSGLPGSYSADWLALHQTKPVSELIKAEATLLDQREQEIELDDLSACANHPLRYFYQHALNIRFYGPEADLEETEPFALNGLDMHQLKQALASTWFDETRSETQVLEEWSLSDRLPREPAAELYTRTVREPMGQLRGNLASALPIEAKKVRLEFEDKVITGQLLLSPQGLFSLSLSKHVGSQFFGFWVKHLIWNVYAKNQGAVAGSSRLLAAESVYVFEPLGLEQANAYLREILAWFASAKSSPAAFLAKTAFAQLLENPAKAQTAFRGWRSPAGEIVGEMADPYWQRACTLGELDIQPDIPPDCSAHCLYRQIAEQLEEKSISVMAAKDLRQEVNA